MNPVDLIPGDVLAVGTLVAGAILNSVAAAVFAFVGHRLNGEGIHPHARMAGRAFAVWWWMVATFFFLWGALPMALAALGIGDLVLYEVLLYVSIFVLCLGIGSLVFYLLYLFTGNRGLVVPVLVFYMGLFLAFVYIFATHGPSDVLVQRWWVDVVYERPLGTDYFVALSMLILPATLGALGFLSLVRKTRDRFVRLRIAVVSLSLVVWSLASLIVRIIEWDLGQILARSGVGLVASLLIFAAYEVPAFLQRRFPAAAKESLVLETPGATGLGRSERDRERRRRDEELQWRMRRLV